MCQELPIQRASSRHSLCSQDTNASGDDVFDASVTSQADSNHILLTRPNTFVLCATVPDGKATRGLYTGAIAKQIGNSDGETSIDVMHKQACVEVEQHQIPRMEYTATRELYLPKCLSSLRTPSTGEPGCSSEVRATLPSTSSSQAGPCRDIPPAYPIEAVQIEMENL